jgi:hypothetical protein
MVGQGIKSESREPVVGQGQGLGWAGLARPGDDRGGLARLDRGRKTGDQRQREMWLYWIKYKILHEEQKKDRMMGGQVLLYT